MITCPARGEQNPGRARFCVACGSALPRQGAVPVGAEERQVFGAPIAHEDDPERGVRATLRLRDAVTELAPPEGDLGLSLRAGAAGYARLAPGWVDYGFGLEEARVRLGPGRCLVALGRRTGARGEPEKAKALAEQLGAEPVTSEVDALLEGAPA